MGIKMSSKMKQKELSELNDPLPIRVIIFDDTQTTLNFAKLKLGPFYDHDITNKDSLYYDKRFMRLMEKLLSSKEFELSPDSVSMTILRNPKLLAEMFSIVKRKGIKQKYRWYVWVNLANYDETAPLPMSRQEIYQECLKKNLGQDEDIIIKDAMRTFRDHELFKDPHGLGLKMLARICRGLGAYFPKVGYVQGMNYLVGFLLEVSGFDEVLTWFFIINLFKKKKNLYFALYEPNFPLVFLKIHIFWSILSKTKPKLAAKLKRIEIPSEMWIFKWFVTLYTSILTKEYLLRVWDFLLVGDIFSSVYVALVIVRYLKKTIMNENMSDFVEVVNDPHRLCSNFQMYKFFKKLKDYRLDLPAKLELINSYEPEAKKSGIDCSYVFSTMRSFFSDPNTANDFGYVADYETIERELDNDFDHDN